MSQVKLRENFVNDRVKLALAEDLYPDGDITSNLIKENKIITAKLISNQKAVVAGLLFAKHTFTQVNKKTKFIIKKKDGSFVTIRGLGAQPGKQEEFKRSADLALEYIHHCDFYSINVGAGPIPQGEEKQKCLDVYIENIDYISTNAGNHRCKFLLEPVCAHRIKNWPMQKMAEARKIVNSLGKKNVGLVYDTFHMRYEETGT